MGAQYLVNSHFIGHRLGGLFVRGSTFLLDGDHDSDALRRKRSLSYGIAVIKDSTFRQANGLAGCYIGYDSTVYFDGCTFASPTGALGLPVLYGNYTQVETRAYFSNCKMSGIRVDSGCTAYFGENIADSVRKASVSGTIVNTDDTYRKTVATYIDPLTLKQQAENAALEARIKALEDIVNAEASTAKANLLLDDTEVTEAAENDTASTISIDSPTRWIFDEESGIYIPTGEE